MDEFELIRTILASAPPLPESVVVGPGDDAAVLAAPPDTEWVLSTDTLVEGRHFPVAMPPFLLGWRALAVNLSDLAAMGADPGGFLVALSAPGLEADWARELGRGLTAAAAGTGAALVGGNLARGPLAVSVTVTGTVPRGRALRRSGARVGDGIWVSGTIGLAAAGLAALLSGAERLEPRDEGGALSPALRRYAAPEARVALGRHLRGRASACIDVSDGLLADLGHLCAASGVGARVQLDRVPTVGEPSEAVGAGDDYELVFTLPEPQAAEIETIAAAADVALTRIGRVETAPGVRLVDGTGRMVATSRGGWNHFG